MQVDPYLGGDGAYAALIAAARAKGIRVILDGVFNHTSSDSRYFDRYHRYPDVVGACESASSPYRDWYSITGDCADYAKFAGLDTLPQLNHSNPAVLDFLVGVTKHWAPDGWRLDAAQEIDHRFWRSFRKAVSGPLIGEDTAGPVDATPYLLGDELDGVMNYRFREAALGFAQKLTAAQLDHSLKAILADYPRAASAVSFNLVDSHDTSRVGFVTPDGQRLVALLQYTSFGAPMLYYGDEAGIIAPDKNGFSDPYNRASYPWGTEDESLLDYYRKLGAIRHELPALRTGSLVTQSAKGNVYAFERLAPPDKPVIVVLNKGAAPVTVKVPGSGLVDRLTGRPFTGSVPARGGVVLVGSS
jgi:4-alpha-glucanotransferase